HFTSPYPKKREAAATPISISYKLYRESETAVIVGDYDSNLASMVIFAFKTFDTGQPALAPFAACSNTSGSMPGILALTSRCTVVMVKPPSSGSMATVAVVLMRSGLTPASPNSIESAMEKQPA